MDKKKAKEFIEFGKEDSTLLSNINGVAKITFARAEMGDVKRIEELSDRELLEEWQSYAQLIDVIECFSIMDLQIRELLEMEIHERNLDDKAEILYNKILHNQDMMDIEEDVI